MRNHGSVAVIVGVLLLVIGGVLIGVAWDGAAELDYVQGQFPYLLSGAIPGLGLIVLGTAVLVLQTLRRDATERAAQLERLNAAVAELATLVGPRDEYDPRITGEYRPRPRVAAANGNGEAPTQQIPAATSGFERGR